MNNSMMPRSTSDARQSLEELRAQVLNQEKTAEVTVLDTNELASLEQTKTEEAVKEVEGPVLVKSFQTGFNRNGFVDALILGFLTAVAGLTSFLYMLFSINGVLY